MVFSPSVEIHDRMVSELAGVYIDRAFNTPPPFWLVAKLPMNLIREIRVGSELSLMVWMVQVEEHLILTFGLRVYDDKAAPFTTFGSCRSDAEASDLLAVLASGEFPLQIHNENFLPLFAAECRFDAGQAKPFTALSPAPALPGEDGFKMRELGGLVPQSGGLPWGRCEIVGQLRYRNPDLLRLEEKYCEALRIIQKKRLPGLRTLEVIGLNDDVAPEHPTPGKDALKRGGLSDVERLRADHFSVKEVNDLPAEHNSGKPVGTKTNGILGRLLGWVGFRSANCERVNLIPNVLVKYLRWAEDRAAAAIALITVAQTFNVERLDDITEMFTDLGPVVQPEPRQTIRVMGTDQAGAVKWMREVVDRGDQAIRTLLVSGDAGVGKSSVVRWFARELALRFLAPGENPPPWSSWSRCKGSISPTRRSGCSRSTRGAHSARRSHGRRTSTRTCTPKR